MGKRGRSAKKDDRKSKRRARAEDVDPEDMDDEIDAFHKQRDVVPLNIHGDAGDSDDDKEEPVFDFEDADDEDNDEDNEMDDDDSQLTGLAAKIARQQRYLREKMGGAEDEMDEEEEEKEKDNAVWGRSKRQYYNADEATSSDEELLVEEEAEVLRMQREKAKSLSMEDFGLEDISEEESDKEPTLGEIAIRGQDKIDSDIKKDMEDNGVTDFEEVKKDLNALSKEEQMDVVYSSAPELVGLLLELYTAVEELEERVNPLISTVKDGGNASKEGVRYLEVKQILLLSYCQAITFYLLLKSEGQPVRDHPVIGRLVEIKNLLDKMKELDENLPSQLEEVLVGNKADQTVATLMQEKLAVTSEASPRDYNTPAAVNESQEVANHLEVDSLDGKNQSAKEKPQNGQFGAQSMKMLKVRAALEEKLRQKGILSSAAPKGEKNRKHLKPVNGMLETREDFDDNATGSDGTKHGLSNGNASLSESSKLSSLIVAKQNKTKIISGDDDLPRRDDIGERRRKHELQVLAGAGIEPEDEAGIADSPPRADLGSDSENSVSEESGDEFYEQVKQQRAAKLAAKAEKYSRNSTAPALPETVDGKRLITYQMEKNRGLTRARKKLTKNPRKKYRTQHQKAVVRRKGQVREVRKPSGPYGGEASGINAGISRSIRFKG
ncbi:something about silencing protein 10 isoform X2 [Punica granatum]|uniref:Something about silencing protein 10 isoform X2 n=1 Tax=Punica granatum TaxID=22663 RepID=A0A6P8C8V6_PUNGR|nr:something about silencing protein 10 isoform X2 [Punica granatum]